MTKRAPLTAALCISAIAVIFIAGIYSFVTIGPSASIGSVLLDWIIPILILTCVIIILAKPDASPWILTIPALLFGCVMCVGVVASLAYHLSPISLTMFLVSMLPGFVFSHLLWRAKRRNNDALPRCLLALPHFWYSSC